MTICRLYKKSQCSNVLSFCWIFLSIFMETFTADVLQVLSCPWPCGTDTCERLRVRLLGYSAQAFTAEAFSASVILMPEKWSLNMLARYLIIFML